VGGDSGYTYSCRTPVRMKRENQQERTRCNRVLKSDLRFVAMTSIIVSKSYLYQESTTSGDQPLFKV